METIKFRFTASYVIDDYSFNVQFITKKGVINFNEEHSVGFGMFSRKYNGEYKNQLFIYIQDTEADQSTVNLYNRVEALDSADQEKLDQIAQLKIGSLSIRADEMLRRFRWLTKLPFDLKKRGEPLPLEWSNDGQNWSYVPYEPEVTYIPGNIIGDDPTSIIDEELIEKLIIPNLSLEEPLGHDLLLEAFQLLRNRDLRGAFMIGYTALEVGVKEYIRKKVPDTAWLLMNSPSPDLLKICGQYLPTLDSGLSIDKTTEKRIIGKYMISRNKLVHQGVFEENSQTVAKKLYTVEYMLHRFDYSLGFKRALVYANYMKDRVEYVGLEDLPKE